MRLPSCLEKAIDTVCSSSKFADLSEARKSLTDRYQKKAGDGSSFIESQMQRKAYLISRMPATYAALNEIFEQIKKRALFSIESFLDLGAGPGTGIWAAIHQFPSLCSATLIEKDEAFASLGKQLIEESAEESAHEVLKKSSWIVEDLEKIQSLPPCDLVLFSYSFGELSSSARKRILKLAWEATKQVLLIVEPGTPAGFERILAARADLIAAKAHLIAPCPHALSCPLPKGDWCHFAARVERSSLHRKIKEGQLGHEDEKFSYLAAAKSDVAVEKRGPFSSVLRRPQRHCGHILLDLCSPLGLEKLTISKRTKEPFRQAKKIEWGDPLFR